MTLPNYPDPAGAPGVPELPTGTDPAISQQPGWTPPPSSPEQLGYPAQPGYPGQPGWTPPPGYPPYPAYVYAPAQPTNGMAIASMVTSIAAFVICGGLFGIVGAILGHVARKQCRERGEQGEGMALAGIIVGWIGFGIGLLIITLYIGMFAFLFTLDPTTTYE
jgi:uncharacterized protein DUF4190